MLMPLGERLTACKEVVWSRYSISSSMSCFSLRSVVCSFREHSDRLPSMQPVTDFRQVHLHSWTVESKNSLPHFLYGRTVKSPLSWTALFYLEPRGSPSSWTSQYSCSCLLCIIGASLSEPHTSVTALRTRVCIQLCLDRPLTRNFKSADSNISRWMSTPMCTAAIRAKQWERAWRAAARLQGRRQRDIKDDSSWMPWQHIWQLTFWTMLRVTWQGRQLRVTIGTGFRYAPGMTAHT